MAVGAGLGSGMLVVVLVEVLAVVAGSGAREKELDSEARKLLPLCFAGSLEVEVEESTPLVWGAVGVPGTGDRRSEEPVNGFGAEPTTRAPVGTGEETPAGTAVDESKTTGSRALNDLFRVSTSFGTGSSCSTKLFASDSTPPPAPPREERE